MGCKPSNVQEMSSRNCIVYLYHFRCGAFSMPPPRLCMENAKTHFEADSGAPFYHFNQFSALGLHSVGR
jgi:hypothetical protein